MNEPLIDVIIPTYNGMPFLKQAAESVLSQTHKNLTLYVVDDGSTDEGLTKNYIKGIKDKRVRYVRKKNGGQASARNYGIVISSAPYVAFLDADDIWHKDKLTKQLAVFGNNPNVGLVYGLHNLVDEKGRKIGEVTWRRRGDLFDYLLHGNRVSGSGSMVLVRRDVFEKVGVFHEDFLIGEDWEMWLRIARDYQVDYVDELIADLRVLGNGMQQNHLKMARGLDYMLPVIIKEFNLKGRQKRILTGACLAPTIHMYFNGDDKKTAKRNLYKLLRYNPLALWTTNPNVWKIYARLLLGNDLLRSGRRKLSSSYRAREVNVKK